MQGDDLILPETRADSVVGMDISPLNSLTEIFHDQNVCETEHFSASESVWQCIDVFV